MMIKLLLWAGSAGALIPVMAILNARLGRSVGVALHAPIILFSVGLLFCILISLAHTNSMPNLNLFKNALTIDYLGGVIVGFYVISATLLAPKIGVANFILCAVSSQIIISVLIDHYGLLGAPIRTVNLLKLAGVFLLLLGLLITQFADYFQNKFISIFG